MQGMDIESDRNQPPISVDIDVDGLGGGELKGFPGTSVSIITDGLQYLDVIDCSSLVHLDLSHCQPGSHITIRHCPSLREICVRADGSGAVIHLDAGDQIPSLQVEGLVDHIDACWASGQFSVNSADCPWNGLWIIHRLDSIPDIPAATSAECWVLLAPEMAHVVIDTPQLRHLYVSGGKRLQALSVVSLSEKHAQIEAQGLPELLSLDIHSPDVSGRIRDCRSLTSVSGVIGDLHLTHVANRVDALRIEMSCDRLVLSHSSVNELVLSEPTQLSLIHCKGLDTVSLPPMTSVHCEGPVPTSLIGVATIVVDESVVASLVNKYPRDPEGVMEKLATLIPSMSPSSPCVKALQLLHQLVDVGAPPEKVWLLRTTLSSRHIAPRVKSTQSELAHQAIAAGHWKWHLPEDLCREGWMADYQLWVKCAPAVSDAYHFRRAIIRACLSVPDGVAMQTVMHSMARSHAATTRQELYLWNDILEGMASKEPMSVAAWPRYARMLISRYGRQSNWDRRYLSACETLLSLEVLLDIIQSLGVHRPEIRACCLRIAHRSSNWREQRCDSPRQADGYRARASALAISQKTTLFMEPV